MRLWHRHEWTKWGPPYTRWDCGERSFQARTCETCGMIKTRKLGDELTAVGSSAPTPAPSIPLERDHPVQ